jgi:hypothetical protein
LANAYVGIDTGIAEQTGKRVMIRFFSAAFSAD